MVVSRDKTPSAQETFLQMAQAAGLRGRLLITIALLILVRLGIFIPIPGIDRQALGILPYINASIILQLLTAAVPALEDLQKNEGEAGRRKISQYTRYVAVGWAIIQSIGLTVGLLRPYAPTYGPVFIVQTSLALTAGSLFVMWISELITERGI